ncbi:MAG: hypothetical protein LC657_15150 [Desulfobacteraceae bacterium]|nr:hypothetical protein [Desulfobacteraceae bacterium]
MIKKVLADHAQEMGYRLPDPEPTQKRVIKVISARRRAEREALKAQQEAEKKAEMESLIQEKTGMVLPEEDDPDLLKKLAKNLEDTFG